MENGLKAELDKNLDYENYKLVYFSSNHKKMSDFPGLFADHLADD